MKNRRTPVDILKKLSGGDRRSIGRADEVSEEVLRDPSRFGQVFAGMLDEDEVIRLRAADATEKITRVRPDLLVPFKRQLLEQVAQIHQAEVRWHAAQMIPRIPLNQRERTAAVALLQGYLQDQSRIVQTFALQALYDLAQADSSLQDLVSRQLEEAAQSGSPAVRSRARKLLRPRPAI